MVCSLRRLLEVATYGSKGFLGGNVDVLGEFLRGSKGSSKRGSGVTGRKGSSRYGGVTVRAWDSLQETQE